MNSSVKHRPLPLVATFVAAILLVWTQPSFAKEASEPDKKVESKGKDADKVPSDKKSVEKKEKKQTSQIAEASHRQSGYIVPMVDGEAIHLNTFCLAKDGSILAACGGKQTAYVMTDSGFEAKELDQPACLLKLDSTGKLLERWDLEFTPTAVNVSPQGDIFVAGSGAIARITDGKIAGTGKAPHLGDIEEFKERAIKQAEEQAKEMAEMFSDQTKSLEKRIAKIEKVDEADRTKVQKAQLEAFKQQLEMFSDMGGADGSLGDTDQIVDRAMTITSIAVSAKDVFWVCQDLEGHGYSIWRTNHKFEDGEQVMDGVSGCCGQMDIQCCEGNLVIAENSNFKIALYDRDGKSINGFGERDRSSSKGFGSCCNPMNVRPLADGTLLTAESSIGHIKRFDQEGNFIEYVGRAKVGGGCKHCAVGYNADRDQYYMMHEDESKIVVLSNQSTMPAQTDEEAAIAKLMTAVEPQLLGTWKINKQEKAKSEADDEFGFSGDFMFDSVAFLQEGKLAVTGGMNSGGSMWAWEPISGDDKTITISMISDQVEMMKLGFAFSGEHAAKVTLSGFGPNSEYEANRVKDCNGKACGTACEENAKPQVTAAAKLVPAKPAPAKTLSKKEKKALRKAQKKELEGKSPEEQKALKKKWRAERKAAEK